VLVPSSTCRTGSSSRRRCGVLRRSLLPRPRSQAQQAIEPQLCLIAQDGAQGIDRTGNADGVRRCQRDRTDVALRDTIQASQPAARGRSRYRRRSCPPPWAEPAQSNPPIPVDCGSITPSAHRPHGGVGCRLRGTQHLDRRQRASGCDVATIAFWAWTVDRPADGNSSCQMTHLSFLTVALQALVYMAYS